ncbi:MAG: GNAT family N-acetyltransferase [bacterium]
MQNKKLTFSPLTPENWQDFETLFGEKGACGGCWCMWLRLKRSEYEAQKGEGNRRAMKALVESGKTPGILAYHNAEPVAWCSISRREEYSVLSRSRNLKPIDKEPVWSIVCFFVAKSYRRKGVTNALVHAAVNFAKQQGAKIVEGYPIDPVNNNYPEVFACPGLFSAFQKTGFIECARRSETRPIMRYFIE